MKNVGSQSTQEEVGWVITTIQGLFACDLASRQNILVKTFV